MRSPLRTLTGRIVRRVEDKAPVPYTGRRGVLSWAPEMRSDKGAQLQAMESVGTLFAIVDRLATAVAEVGWHLYRKAASGKDEDRVEVTSHLALDIWSKPNPWMPRGEFVEVFQQHLDLVGEAWWVVARNPRMRSIPLELWPVRPDRMAAVPDPTEFIAGYVYTSPDGEKVPLKVDEVIMLRRPHPMTPYGGISPVGSVLPDLASVRHASEWTRNFFINSALPGGIVEVPHEWNDTEFDNFRDRWEEQHRGVAAAHRVAILEGGARWVERRFTMADMQFVELRGASREVIREAYAIHGHTLGLSETVNRANAEAADASFARWQVKPRLERIKQALNHDFLPLFGATADGLEWDYANPIPEDRELATQELNGRAESAQRLVAAGFEPSAVLEAVGLPDMPYTGPPAGASAPPLRNAVVEMVRDVPSARLGLGPVRAQDDRERIVERVMQAIRETFEQALAALLDAWRAVSASWRRQLVEQVRAALDDGDMGMLAHLEVNSDRGHEVLSAAMEALASDAARQAVEEAAAQGVEVEAGDPPDLSDVATVTVALLASGLAVSAAGAALHLAGRPAGEVARLVGEHLEGLGDRALRDRLGAALHGAQQAGRMATLEDAPEPRAWIASEFNDANTCANCSTIDGHEYTSFAAARAAYPNGAYWACLGWWRCRGSPVPIWDGEG